MEKPNRALLATIAIIIAVAACVHLWTWLEPACIVEGRRVIMKMQGGVGCFEFWLNRYQSLLGAIISLVAALLVLRSALRQVEEMKKQNQVLQIAQIDKNRERLRRERGVSSDIDEAIAIATKEFLRFTTEDAMPSSRTKWEAGIERTKTIIYERSRDARHADEDAVGSEKLVRARKDFLAICRQALAQIDLYAEAIADYYDGGAMPHTERFRRQSQIKEIYHDLVVIKKKYQIILR